MGCGCKSAAAALAATRVRDAEARAGSGPIIDDQQCSSAAHGPALDAVVARWRPGMRLRRNLPCGCYIVVR